MWLRALYRSEDGPLTHNIDKVTGGWIFRRRGLIRGNRRKSEVLVLAIFIFSKREGQNMSKKIKLDSFEAAVHFRIIQVKIRSVEPCEKYSDNLVHPISQVNLVPCCLCWQFEDQKNMYLDLQVFSVIHPGTMYDTGLFELRRREGSVQNHSKITVRPFVRSSVP